MGSLPQSAILDILQEEFSPPLDSSLVAAIIADYVSGDSPTHSTDQIQTCREILSQLATLAEKELRDEDALSEQLSNVQITSYSTTDDTHSLSGSFSPDSSQTNSSGTSDVSSQHSFSSPLGFLQAAFPHIATPKLKNVLSSLGDADTIDMESVVESILSSEYVRELEERGMDALDEADGLLDYGPDWSLVEGKKKPSPKTAKKTKKRGTTITLVDIRQKQHERPALSSSRIAPPDPWTQLSSVASYLSTLIPTHSASFFQSVFHSPEHTTPAKALRAALRSVVASAPGTSVLGPDSELTPEEAPSLFSMLDILSTMPEYANLDAEQRDQLTADVQLALRATRMQPDIALDIVRLFLDLDNDSASGEHEWGVYHSPAPSSSPPMANGPIKAVTLPSGPPPVPPPPRPRSRSPANKARVAAPPMNAWKTIPQRQPSGPHPLAESIPAYRRKVRSGGNGLGKGGKGDVGELGGRLVSGVGGHRLRARELTEMRRDALREASRAWQRGNAKTRGGEVAFYYAERARELQQQARQEQMDATREMVQAKRSYSMHGDTVDLHGATVVEGVQIVKDILRDGNYSPSRPLRIITGRGTHSVNGVGVLAPAVKSALLGDGWAVGSFEGGLVVRGKSAWRTL